MQQYLDRYNTLTTNGQPVMTPGAAPDPALAQPGPPQYAPQQVPPRNPTNYLPQAPANSPMLPPSVVNPAGVQQQQQSIGAEFMPVLQGLAGLAQKYPELDEQLKAAGSQVMACMQQIAAKFSEGGIPRSIV